MTKYGLSPVNNDKPISKKQVKKIAKKQAKKQIEKYFNRLANKLGKAKISLNN